MSRSYLRDKWMRKITDGRSFFASKMHIEPRNKHRQDEMPKNFPSKYIIQHIDWVWFNGFRNLVTCVATSPTKAAMPV